MHVRHLGYACLNRTLATTSRTLRLASLRTETVLEPAIENLDSLLATLRWNAERGIRFFRVSSGLIPFASHAAFPFDWREAFDWKLSAVRRLAKAEGMRLTMHPGQYTVLNSPRASVVEASVAELEYHAEVLRRIDPAQGTMTLHIGGAYGNKQAAMDRFEQNLDRLSEEARVRLAIENDDRTFTLAETVALAERTGLPVIVDLFHHRCNPSGETWDDGLPSLLARAVGTWGERVPKLHLSSQKPGTATGHADYLDMDDVELLLDLMAGIDGDAPFDLMLEAKHKECALLEVRHYLETGERPGRAVPMAA